MLNVVIIGASGYAGAELAAIVQKHPHLNLKGLYVSAASQDANKPFSALYPRFASLVDLPIKPLNEEGMNEAKSGTD
ncbi:MAG: N-acetyl-gamma-glutamyl-phosphate reductase, partial [Aeromonas sp.]|nr:N-acetyl-gamma-glutamyl-phosphate reductase [Aeromonas sp.]